MAAALLVECGCKPRWHPRRFAVVGGIAGRARRAGRPTAAGVVVVPRSLRMALADPAAIVTGGACRHQRSPGHHVDGGLNADIFVDLSAKRDAMLEFIRANRLNRTVASGGRNPKIGIITTGKSYLDVGRRRPLCRRDALERLLDLAARLVAQDGDVL
jgi:hypothetical protein